MASKAAEKVSDSKVFALSERARSNMAVKAVSCIELVAIRASNDRFKGRRR